MIGNAIGQGGLGEVFRGTWKVYNETTDAAFKRAHLKANNDQSNILDLEREVDILRQLSHNFIVRFLGVFEDSSLTGHK